MRIKIFQIDAFTDKLYGGNSAAVCILDKYPDDELMQKIAAENNLAETAFVVPNGADYNIRWFTPTVEVDLCGHATLASAFVLFNFYETNSQVVTFQSKKSGVLQVEKENDLYSLNFPADTIEKTAIPEELIKALGFKAIECYKGKTDYLLIFKNQEIIEKMKPDFNRLANIDGRGVIVTAQGNDCDFVSRFFAPQSGIDEDPVTGSAHTTLTPYWSKVLNKKVLVAKQLSKRKGYLICQQNENRVSIKGKAVSYLQGEIEI